MTQRRRAPLLPTALAVFTVLACSSDDPPADADALDAATANAPDASDRDAGPTSTPGEPAEIVLPGLEAGNGFDDLRYSPTLGKMLAPGNYTGNVYLIDADSLEVDTIGGFTDPAPWNGSDTQGPATLDEGDGFIFVADRTETKLFVVDPSSNEIVAESPLAAYPDYLRYVASTREVWVTEPLNLQIEVLSIPESGTPTPTSEAIITLTELPQGLGVDDTRGLVFTQDLLGSHVIVLSTDTHTEVAQWPIGCAGTHGNAAVDVERGFVFATCMTASVYVLDADDDGALLDSFDFGAGVGLPSYAPSLEHLYLRGDPGASIAILDVADDGTLTELGRAEATDKGHCLTADDQGHVWTCDWPTGALLRFDDTY